ncbi:MAG: hypothetical protein KDA62_13995, partial [Planctomycetales bacterium]|nr:hypothetical protein [Planctomycetales bacterium]
MLKLRSLDRHLYANVTGTEGRRFRAFRESLDHYLDLVQTRTPAWQNYVYQQIFPTEKAADSELLAADNPQAQYEQLVARLATELSSYAESNSSEVGWRIGRLVGLLDRVGRAPEVVAAVRERYWKPNFFGRVSERVLNAGVDNQVREVTPVHDNILGTSVHGTAVLSGFLKLDLVPSDDTGRFAITLAGVAHSNTVGYNRGVQIFSTGVSQINASKQVIVDANGLTSTAAVARVCTDTTINCISAKLRIVERIAWKRAGAQKGAAERVAARKAEVRTANRMNEQAAELLADANRRFEEKFRTPLVRMAAYPRLLETSSSDDYLYVRAMSVNDDQLAAPGAPPVIETSGDVTAQVHESLVGNVSEMVTNPDPMVTAHKIEKSYQDAKREVPEELRMDNAENELWSFNFLPTRPVRAEFAPGQITVAIYATDFAVYDDDFDTEADNYQTPREGFPLRDEFLISAQYNVEQTADGVQFVRQGEVSVEFPNRQRIGLFNPRDALLRVAQSTLKKKFNAMFKEIVNPEDIPLQGQGRDAGRLRMRSADSRQGWLLLTWELLPPEVKTAAVASPASAQ